MSNAYNPKDKLSEEQKTYIATHIKTLFKQFQEHEGSWLTIEACADYRRKAEKLSDHGGQDIGERRRLRIELQEEYGLLEIEAINIINGTGARDYVAKYDLIRAVQYKDEWIGEFEEKLKKEKAKQEKETERRQDDE